MNSERFLGAPLEAFVARAPVAMAMFDLDLRCVAASERWLSDHGLERSPIGTDLSDVFPEFPELWNSALRRSLAGATEQSEGEPFERPDGRIQWVKWSASPWRDGRGAIGGIVLTTEDVTAHKQAEADADRLRSVVMRADDAIIVKTLESIVTDLNPAATRLLGYSAQEMIGRSIACIFPPDRMSEENRILDRVRAGETVEQFETQRVARDGSVLDVVVSIAPVRDARGTIVGAAKILRDITGRRKAEAALRACEERFQTLVEEAPDGILLVDFDRRRMTAANRAAARLLGASRDEILGRDPLAFLAPEQPDGRPAAESFAEHGWR